MFGGGFRLRFQGPGLEIYDLGWCLGSVFVLRSVWPSGLAMFRGLLGLRT